MFQWESQSSHGAGGGNNIGCFGCHAGIVNFGGIANNGAQRGNVHGRTFVWPTGTFSSGFTTDSFILGGWMSGWNFSGATGYCQGGQCNHANSSKNYSR